ncbi:uncharacterized protein LOC144442945 [Glandiceps talaboti]
MGIFSSKSTENTETSLWETQTLSVPGDKELCKYDYPFENLVFEGGGAKGIAYHGAMKVLNDVGIGPNLKRFAGTSIGGLVAALMSVGYSASEISPMMSSEVDNYLMDHSCGFLSFLPNMMLDYGWNPGRKMLTWLGDKIEEKTGDKDITFKQIYLKYDKELCIVVTNVNQMVAEYCHVKTTPDMPIRLAVRMTVSIPGMYEPVRYYNGANVDMYVDGGLLVNYPIHCFDGWWLSMKSEDGFLRRLSELRALSRLWAKKARFGEYNNKTLGILLYTSEDHEINEHVLEERRLSTLGNVALQRPDTKLTKEKRKKNKLKEGAEHKYTEKSDAMGRFVQVLAQSDLDTSATIDRTELESAFKKTTIFTREDAVTLFGEQHTLDSVFNLLDKDKDGEISMLELIRFAEETGIQLWSLFNGYGRYEVSNVTEYLTALQETILTNVKRLYHEEQDFDRTIGVYLDYIGGGDFFMESGDKQFAIEQGAQAARTFLHYYVEKFKPPLKEAHNLQQVDVTIPK